MASVQVDASGQMAIVASASLALDHVTLFGPGEKGEVLLLAPQASTDWFSIVDALGFTINTYTMRISITTEKVDATRSTLGRDRPSSKQ